MSESKIDNIKMDNNKLRDKQKTLKIDNSVENIQRDDMSIENPLDFTSNIHELQDINKRVDVMGKYYL